MAKIRDVNVVVKGKSISLALISSKYPGTCTLTGRRYKAGDHIAYGVVNGTKHCIKYPVSIEYDTQEAAPVKREPEGTFKPNKFQTAVVNAFKSQTEHIAVKAGAGSGKTRVSVEAKKSKPGHAIFLAFGKKNAVELKDRYGMTASTFNSYGNGILKNAFKNVEFTKGYEYGIISSIVPADNSLDAYKSVIKRMLDCSKNWALLPGDLTGIDATIDNENAPIDIGNLDRQVLVALTNKVLSACVEQFTNPLAGKPRLIDFADQLYLPAILDVQFQYAPEVLIDEAQDCNRAQHIMVQKMIALGSRIIIIGDPRQAIFGFRGADAASFDKLIDILRNDKRGMVELPLPINYRCSRSVIRNVNKRWPELQAHDGAPEGKVDLGCTLDNALSIVRKGDAFLCRTRKPLIETAMQYIKKPDAVPVIVVGWTEIKKDLLNLIESVSHCVNMSLAGFMEALERYEAEMEAKFNGIPKMAFYLAGIKDNIGVIEIFMAQDGVRDRNSLCDRIKHMFAEKHSPDEAVSFGTIHGAKGLEWPRVFDLAPCLRPHPRTITKAQQESEDNLSGVLETRAKLEYYEITDCPAAKKQASEEQE